MSSLTNEKLKLAYELMIKTRCLEERLIKMSKSSDGYFWIGGPGEEAFGIPLGMLAKKGEGPDYDYFHLHYRGSTVAVGMGVEMIDPIRQMHTRATDPYSAGRNFVNHYAIKKWNIVPVTPTIETQYVMAPGTAYAQKRHGGDGITIVTGGDAGTAEGDFASCLIWSSIPGKELPLLIIVMNNSFGISTPFNQVHGEKNISDRGKAFGIKTKRINGNDPVESWNTLEEVMAYIRKYRKPYLLEVDVSRLHGHSSSTGGNYVENEYDCIRGYEKTMIEKKLFTKEEIDGLWKKYTDEATAALAQAKTEPPPQPSDIWKNVFVE